jgi:hypothetical protein
LNTDSLTASGCLFLNFLVGYVCCHQQLTFPPV